MNILNIIWAAIIIAHSGNKHSNISITLDFFLFLGGHKQAWLKSKITPKTRQYTRVLLTNLIALANKVSEIYAFIQTNSQTVTTSRLKIDLYNLKG